jgi:hypothetical protein
VIQAKDVPETDVFAAIDATKTRVISGPDKRVLATTPTWEIQKQLHRYPPKVVLARLRAMHRRKLIDAQCSCGCRGDWCRPEESPWSQAAGHGTTSAL